MPVELVVDRSGHAVEVGEFHYLFSLVRRQQARLCVHKQWAEPFGKCHQLVVVQILIRKDGDTMLHPQGADRIERLVVQRRRKIDILYLNSKTVGEGMRSHGE